MAVTDFGSGRFDDSRPRKRRIYGYDHRAFGDSDDFVAERYDAYDDTPHGPEPLSVRVMRLTHYIGALLSVVLVLGLVVWGYRLVARDVSGVPVIRALEGDARITPDEPGGVLAEHEGLAVNAVAAGVDEPYTEEVAVAPQATGLTDDDLPMAALPVAEAEIVPTAEAPLGIAGMEGQIGADDVFAAGNENAPFVEAPIVETAAVEETVAPALAARPAPRPRSVVVAAQAAPAAAPAPAATEVAQAAPEAAPVAEPEPEPAPATARVASGAPLVQIGAFDSDSVANSEWGRISGRFGALFAGKAQVIQRTEKDGRTFYRLRVAGFDSRDDARRFCAALIAEGTDCYPATAQ